MQIDTFCFELIQKLVHGMFCSYLQTLPQNFFKLFPKTLDHSCTLVHITQL